MRIKMDDCTKCGGKGYIVNRKRVLYRCSKCGGRGELDWVEQVVGRNPEIGVPSIDYLIDLYRKENKQMLYDWKDFLKNGTKH